MSRAIIDSSSERYASRGTASTVVVGMGLVLSVAMTGCGPKRGAQFVSDPDPAVKIPAIQQATQGNRQAAVPQLIDELSSDDPAVRFYAIGGLKRLTGQTFDYVYYASDDDRRAAIDRWRTWFQQQPKASD